MPITEAHPKNPIGETLLTRRQVLQGGLLAGSAAFLAACGVSPEGSKSPDQLDPTEKLFRYLGNLPDLASGGSHEQQNLKDLLINHASNYFVSPTPTAVRLGGEEILVINPEVTSGFTPDTSFQAKTEFIHPGAGPAFTSNEDAILSLPFPDLVRPSEKGDLKPENFFADGSIKAPVQFNKGDKVNMYLNPVINVNVPRTINNQQKGYIQYREQVEYIKEAATLMAFDLWVTEMANASKQLNADKTITVTTPNGQTIEKDVFMAMLSAFLAAPASDLSRPPGRFIALLDLTGYFFMFKALKGTDLRATALTNNPKWKAPIDAADAVSAAGNDHELLASGINWALDNIDNWKLNDPNNSLLAHIGNLYKLP